MSPLDFKPDPTPMVELSTLGADIPEGVDTVKIRFSVTLLRQMAVDPDMEKLPRGIQLVKLGEPDSEGCYTPVFRAIYG